MNRLRFWGLLSLIVVLTACSSTQHRVSTVEDIDVPGVIPEVGTEGTPEFIPHDPEMMAVPTPMVESLPQQDITVTEPLHERDLTQDAATEDTEALATTQSSSEEKHDIRPKPHVPPSLEPPHVASLEDKFAMELRDIFFDFDEAAIRVQEAAVLETNARLLQSRFQDQVVLIEGHCDERGSVEYNLILGARRAQTIKAYLVDLGVAPTRIRVVSYGKERPFCTVQEEYCWQQNRRGHFVLQ